MAEVRTIPGCLEPILAWITGTKKPGSLSKIDVVPKACFCRRLEQLQQVLAFGLPGSAAVENDQAGFRRFPRQGQEILPIAGQDDELISAGMIPDVSVVGPVPWHLGHSNRPMAVLEKKTVQFDRNILVDQKVHASSWEVWAAMSGSSSSR